MSAPAGFLPRDHFLVAGAFDPDHDGDDDSTPEGDTDHDFFGTDGRPQHGPDCQCPACRSFRSGMDWAKSVQPRYAASGLPQIQQHTDPNNNPVPQDDDLPEGVAFPLGDNAPSSTFRQQWSTGPDGPQPRTGMIRAQAYADLSSNGAHALGRADAMGNIPPTHKDQFGSSKQKHRRYLEGWNETAGLIHGLVGRAPMSQREYHEKTGRGDLHSHYLEAYARGRAMHGDTASLYRADDGGQVTAVRQVTADTWSQPHQTTDDFDPPYNSPETSPDPWSANTSPESGDFAAGAKAGQADKAAGERPLFADNSSGVSPYVKGYAQGYGQPSQFGTQQDVPHSMGGDSGQAYNAQQAQQSFQVARASKTASVQDAWAEARDNLEAQHQVDGGHPVSGAPGNECLEGEGTGGRSGATWRVSASFAPDSLMKDPEFSKAYRFAQIWEPGLPLVKQGSARFEAGLYAGISDRDRASQTAWLAEHARHASKHPELARRIALHESFTVKVAKKEGIRAHGVYVQGMNARQAGTMTDLITDGPGTSPDPMGATPLNGPGSPPPMGGLGLPAAPGGAPPYQGAPPLPGGPVVPDDVMGKPQQPPTPDGAFTNTFSGNHPENAVLAPVAPNTADQSGYSNHDAYQGSPRGADRLAAFRSRVQANLAQSGAR